MGGSAPSQRKGGEWGLGINSSMKNFLRLTASINWRSLQGHLSVQHSTLPCFLLSVLRVMMTWLPVLPGTARSLGVISLLHLCHSLLQTISKISLLCPGLSVPFVFCWHLTDFWGRHVVKNTVPLLPQNFFFFCSIKIKTMTSMVHRGGSYRKDQ